MALPFGLLLFVRVVVVQYVLNAHRTDDYQGVPYPIYPSDIDKYNAELGKDNGYYADNCKKGP